MSADLVLFPGVITHFVWVLLAFMALVVACGALWIVGGFVAALVEEACMRRTTTKATSSTPPKIKTYPNQPKE